MRGAMNHSGVRPVLTVVSGRIEAAPSGGGTPTQGLTHSLDVTKEGMDVESTRICPEPQCDRPIRARGLCATHYQALRRSTQDGSCGVPECPGGDFTRGYCAKHYSRLMKFGSTDLPRRSRLNFRPGVRADADPSTCAAPDCTRPAVMRSSGPCEPHHRHVLTQGEAGLRVRVRMRAPRGATTDERFWSKVDKTSGCWYWRGATSSTGYGNFYLGENVWVHAHRYAFGPVPEGMELDHVCHTVDTSCAATSDCHHRRCVNPAHLEPVTGTENKRRARERSINERETA